MFRLTGPVAAAVVQAAALLLAAGSAVGQPASRGFDVEHYAAEVRPDLATGSVSGRVAIRLRPVGDLPLRAVFQRGALVVDRVTVAGAAVPFETPDGRLVVALPAAGGGDARTIEVAYHGTPRFGLTLLPQRQQAYTIFSTSQWLVCVDEPDDKATLDLRLELPDDLQVVASGAPDGRTPTGRGTVVHRWRLDRPHSTFTMGFAAGRFAEAIAQRGATALRFLGDGMTASDLARAFADTPAMLAFFEDRSGVPYPWASYTQALVANTVGQEAAGFAMLSEAYGRRLLDDASAVTLSAHELAHQWWGISVSCQAWTHFWLNEGFATFMAAAFVEARFGREAYDRQVAAWRATWERIRAGGGDKPLVFPDWNRPSADDRALVYDKGAYLLHLLRERLGEERFWAAVRDYTRRHAGETVTTADFERAMEQSTGQSLDDLFDVWIHGGPGR
jgi:aminopeptidase N